MFLEVGWHFRVEGVVVEYAEGACGCVGIIVRDPNRQGEVASSRVS